jgi:hypothetical protein
MTLPNRLERTAGLTRRLAQFQDALNAVGDEPGRGDLQSLLKLAGELELNDDDISEELGRVRAALEALDLADRIDRGEMPTAVAPDPLAPGDQCHFVVPVRFGRRRSDQYGHLVLTSGWLKFRGTLDVSVAWSEVADVRRGGREMVVSLEESRRLLRFSCHSVAEAARGGVIAQHLARSARPHLVDVQAAYHAAV